MHGHYASDHSSAQKLLRDGESVSSCGPRTHSLWIRSRTLYQLGHRAPMFTLTLILPFVVTRHRTRRLLTVDIFDASATSFRRRLNIRRDVRTAVFRRLFDGVVLIEHSTRIMASIYH